MTRLPPALARWAHELAGLPPALVAALAPWLDRLALAVGPLPGDHRADAGELDGVDGLTRRGSYQRLLATEWALADELPDEFLRRAAGGEHLFVARAHRAPPRQRRSVVLISAGPSQLGAPRLVHLAALIVLGRRAAAAGAALAWGVLEKPERGLAGTIDPATLAGLLGARTAATPTPGQLAAWQRRLGAPDDDRWLIGGDELAAIARALEAGALVVRDPFEPEQAVLEVDVRDRGAGRARAQVRLPLPAPEVAARLVRDPFAAPPGAPRPVVTTAAGEQIWFVAGGQALAVDHGGWVELFPVPSSPREPLGRRRRFERLARGQLLALGVRRRVVTAVTFDPDRPERVTVHDRGLHGIHKDVLLAPALAASLRATPVTEARPPGLAWFQRVRGSDARLIFVGPGGVPLVASHDVVGFRTAEPLVPPADGEVASGALALASGMVADPLVAHRREHEVVLHHVRGEAVRQVAAVRVVDEALAPEVRVGFGVPPRGLWGPVAVQVEPRVWTIVTDGESPRSITTDARVHGVVDRGGELRLVTDAADGQGLVLRARADAIPLPSADGEVLAAACASPQPVVAWLTRTAIVIYSLRWNAVLARIAREAR